MKTNNQKHRWYDVIVAWAEGKDIQFKYYDDDEWKDYSSGYSGNPAFNSLDLEWRVKPKTITKRYRMAILHDIAVCAVDVTDSCIDDPAEYRIPGFLRWLGEPVEVELEVNDE